MIANGAIPSSCYEAADAALAGENPIGSAMYFNNDPEEESRSEHISSTKEFFLAEKSVGTNSAFLLY